MYLCEYEKCCLSTFMGELANIIPELRTKFRTKIGFSREKFFPANPTLQNMFLTLSGRILHSVVVFAEEK